MLLLLLLFLAYVWSLELIPLFARLNQTLEGLFKVASTSLSFALLRHDTAISNVISIRRRKDLVFSQVVSIMFTKQPGSKLATNVAGFTVVMYN